MYQAEEAKPPPYAAAATGFPVNYPGAANYNSNTPSAPGEYYSTNTSVTTGSYTPPLQPPKPLEDWSIGLCDCFSDIKICCISCWCPCVTFGRVAEIVDKGSTSCGASGALYTLICCLIGCGCLYSCFYRTKMRQQLGLKGSCCSDCLIHCCCEPCALTQEHRELQNKGFDMEIGWHGNVEQRTRGIAMTAPPPPEHAMTR